MNFIEHHGFQVLDMGSRNWLYEDGRMLYKLDNIEDADIIIDLGACFGGFTMFAYEVAKSKTFIAVEPVWYDILQINLENNSIPATVFPFAIAHPKDERGWALMNWDGRELYSQKIALKQILKSHNGKKVFLKCDIEMGEWNLVPEDFANIIRIEIEMHCLGSEVSGTFNQMNPLLVQFLEEQYFIDPEESTITTKNGVAKVFHMYRKKDYPEKASGIGPLSKFIRVP